MIVPLMAGERIEDGAAWVSLAYDIGQHIDLEAAAALPVAAEREVIQHQRRAPPYQQFHPAPVRLKERLAGVSVGGFATDGSVETTIYDFGAASITYCLPIGGRELAELPELAAALDSNPELLGDSRRRVERLLETLDEAVRRPTVSALVEDYTVFHVRRWAAELDPRAIVERNRPLIARILRAERGELREDEVQDALQLRIGYGPRDDLVVDWQGAFLSDPQGEDTLAVLEFANVELLEMRFLDDRLDTALDRSHEMLWGNETRRHSLRSLVRREARSAMRSIATLQIDSAVLFESVNNAVKLLGDQFLARLYRLTARRFHLEEWDASILRKLETLDSIYAKLENEQSAARMEVLEWIIIVLFLVSIVLPFLVGGGH
jgi:hypothetical protein